MNQEEVIADLAYKYCASQDHKEIFWFWEACKKINPKVVVEIGIYAGGTLKILSTLVTERDGLVVGMDYDWHIWKKFGFDLNSGVCPIKLLDGDSHKQETKDNLIKELNGRPIDVLFIDGDHTYSGCDMDYQMYSPLVRSGGIIGVHDLNMKNQDNMRKCGDWWDEFPGPKKDYFSSLHNNTIYGIGYIVKGNS